MKTFRKYNLLICAILAIALLYGCSITYLRNKDKTINNQIEIKVLTKGNIEKD